jgi:hypothetical protein
MDIGTTFDSHGGGLVIARRTFLFNWAAALLIGAMIGRRAGSAGSGSLLCDESGAPLVTELGEPIVC